MIEFTHPDRLFLLLAVLVYLLAAIRRKLLLERKKTKTFPGGGERKKGFALFLEPVLFGGGGLLLVLALAGPVHYRKQKVFKRQGIAIAVCIDVSKSMLAEDVAAPFANRIDQARNFTLDLLGRLDGETVGVGVFAAEGFALVPLTRDYGYCRYLVENLDEMAVSAPGSSLAAGLEVGRQLLQAGKTRPAENAGVVILLSDGEDLGAEPGRAVALAARIRQQNGLVYTLGIGRPRPSLIPIRTPDRREVIDYYRDPENNFLTTARQDALLQKIAAAGGGTYALMGSKPEAKALLHHVLDRASASGRALVVEKRRVDISSWILALAFILLATAMRGENST